MYLVVGVTGAIKDREKRPVKQLYILLFFFIIVILIVCVKLCLYNPGGSCDMFVSFV